MSYLITRISNLFSGLSQETGGAGKVSFTANEELVASARQTAAEGIVLLKNEGNVLPIGKETVVSVFGRVQRDYFYVGYGSGGDVKAPYKVSLIQGIKNNGKIKYNAELSDRYRDWCKNNIPDEGFWGHWPLNFPEMPLTETVVKEAAAKSDVAVVVIGRSAGEDREQKLIKGGFFLTDEESDMLNKVTAAFDNTVAVIDSGNVMDLSWINGFGGKITAALFAWQGGMESGNAVADILSGDVNPSGRLTDTIATTYECYPSAGNFGAKAYNNYVEDIYVGYRFFETFRQDKVLYPFGFGLSYTDFTIEGKTTVKDDGIDITATVTNVGKVSGKEVVQVYVEAPQGKLGKPYLALVDFAKTEELAAGASETLEFKIPYYNLMSYDDSGITGHKSCYLLEEGDYKFYIGRNVRDNKFIGRFHIDKHEVLQQHESCPVEPKNVFDVIYPVETHDGQYRVMKKKVSVRTVSLKKRITENRPAEMPKCNKQITLADVKCGKATLNEFIGTLSPEDLEMLTHGHYKMNSPLGTKGNAGAFGGISESLQSKGVPAAITTDGPSGIRLSEGASLLPCGTAVACTWNTALAQRLYAFVGAEMVAKGSDVLLAPGMNIHRDPLCGRNFEYYSEDPCVTGKIAAAVVNGVQSQGVSACPKHFACNNQETRRNFNDSRVSERALREIYLKGFEICVKTAKPKNLMTSYNKINGVHSYYNYDLVTTILRHEWGYAGNVMTDWWMKRGKSPDFPKIKNNAYRVRAQVDVFMPGGKRLTGYYDNSAVKSYKKRALTLAEMQRSAKNVLNFILTSPSVSNKIK